MSQIEQFYEGKALFVTGGTGFIGKVMLEKLLRSTDVRAVYLLIRDKKGLSSKDRLKSLFNSKLFDILKKEKPHMLQRVIAISGDIDQPVLGLNEKSLDLVLNEVGTTSL